MKEHGLGTAPLGLDDLLGQVGPEEGALVVFVGCVRATEAGSEIQGIRYESYSSMAETKLDRIAQDVGARFSARVVIRHRLGKVAVRAASLVVAVFACHRREAFAAARETVERIKRDVPIWKVDFERVSTGALPR